MNKLKGFVDFNAWDFSSGLEINNPGNATALSTNFFNIQIDSPGSENKYIFDEDKQILICYRGRILYKGDSLIQLYLQKGKDFLKNIPGFFSLILINIKKKEVYLAADSLGLLRFYYLYNKKKLVFSSDISDLAESNNLCKEGLIQYCLINYLVDEHTLYKNIKRVLPASINIFTSEHASNYNYFDLQNHLFEISHSTKLISAENAAYVLKEVVKDYVDDNKVIVTLTSGYDSRLLTAGLLANKMEINSFTFGVEDNYEFKIAGQIADSIKSINHSTIELDSGFENYSDTYFDYINQTKNIELNFNRYHYIFVWNEVKKLFPENNILTGICGDTFLRIVSASSHQSNALLLDLVKSENKADTINQYVNQKKELLHRFDLDTKESSEYLLFLFKHLKENDPYYNHFYLRINFGIRNYFGIELNAEYNLHPTYPVFLDLRYLEALVGSGLSAFNKKLFYKRNKLKLASHKYYYLLIETLYSKLNTFNTNRGFPLKYSSSIIYLPLRIYLYKKLKKEAIKSDLNYAKWRKKLNIESSDGLSFDDSLKLKSLRSL